MVDYFFSSTFLVYMDLLVIIKKIWAIFAHWGDFIAHLSWLASVSHFVIDYVTYWNL